MMRDTTKRDSFISVLNDLDLHSRSKVRDVKTCITHPVVKWHEVAQTFGMVDDKIEMTAKNSCNNGTYGSFEHLLFLVLFCFVLFCFGGL